MDMRQLAAFVAVFEERNITQAAQRLFISQPSLSVTIRQLEAGLGVTLFERAARGVTVTDAARLLYPQARRLLGQARAIGELFRARQQCRPLVIGVEGEVARSQVADCLRRVRAADPSLLLTLESGCCGDVRLAPEELRCEDELFLPLCEESYVLALPPGIGEDEDAWSGADWVCCPAHASHQRLLAMFPADSPGMMFAARAGTLTLAVTMVAAGLGMALLPESLVVAEPDIRVRPLPGPGLQRRIGLCFAAQALDNPAVASLHAALSAAPTPG